LRQRSVATHALEHVADPAREGLVIEERHLRGRDLVAHAEDLAAHPTHDAPEPEVVHGQAERLPVEVPLEEPAGVRDA
jgi:hypothetical protein